MHRPVFAVVLLASLGACDTERDDTGTPDPDTTGPLTGTVQTLVSPTDLRAGEVASVTCSATDTDGEVIEADFLLDVGTGLEVQEGAIRALTVGSWDVTCVAQGAVADRITGASTATVTVTPGPATSLLVTHTPDQVSYVPGDVVTLDLQAEDALGNAVDVGIEDASLNILPSDAVSVADDSALTLLRDGVITVEVEVSTEEGALRGLVVLTVDGADPILTVQNPQTGGMFDGRGPVIVQGNVSDGVSGVDYLQVDGLDVPVTTGGGFITVLPGAHGLRVVQVVARDGVGHVTERSVAWIQSDVWNPLLDAGDDPSALGPRYHLGPDGLSDGAWDVRVSDDLAEAWVYDGVDLVAPQLSSAPVPNALSAALEAPSEFGCPDGWRAQVEGLSAVMAGSPSSVWAIPDDNAPPQLTPTEGGLNVVWDGTARVYFTMAVTSTYRERGAYLSTEGASSCLSGAWSTGTHQLSSVFYADVPVSLTARAELDRTGGSDPIASFEMTTLDIGDLVLSEDIGPTEVLLGTANHFYNGVPTAFEVRRPVEALFPGDSLLDAISQILPSDVLEDGVETFLTERLHVVANGLAAGSHSTDSTLGPGARAAATRVVSTSTAVDATGLSVGTRAGVELVPLRDPGLGAIGRGDCLGAAAPPAVDLSATTDFGVAVPLDLVNSLLHAEWTAAPDLVVLGPEDLDDAVADGTGIDEMRIDRVLPAVASDCAGPSTVRAVARVAVDVVTAGQIETYSLDVVVDAGLRLDAVAGGLSLSATEPVVAVTGGRNAIPEDVRVGVVAAVSDTMVDVLLTAPIEHASTLLPSPDLDLGSAAANGLLLQPRGIFTPVDGWFVLDASTDDSCLLDDTRCAADAVQECLQITTTASVWEVFDDCAARSQLCDGSGDDAECVAAP